MSPIISATLFAADATTPVHSLASAIELRWLDELSETGTFNLKIAVEAVPNIEVGQIVKIAFGASTADYVWAGVIEIIKLDQVGISADGVARQYEVSGRGLRSLLEGAIVYNVAASQTRSFTSVTAGEIAITLIDEAQLRGALGALTYDFTSANDSNNDPFTETLTLDEVVGTSLLSVAAKHQELAVDVYVGPDAVLHYVNQRGTDKSTGPGSVVLRIGGNIGELTEERSGPVRNTVLIASGPDGTTFTTEEDAGSQAAYGRAETFMPLSSTADAGVITLAAAHILLNSAAPGDGVTVQTSDSGPVPYIDYEPGDTIAIVRLDGSRSAYRVRSITVSVSSDGMVSFVPELGSSRPDLTRRLAAALGRIERNNVGSESETASSGGLSGLGGGGAGGAEIFNGEVLTYNENTDDGSVDVDGNTINFTNTTGFGLGVGDIVVLTTTSGIVDPIAVAIFDRAGSYTPTVLNNPQAVAGFPFDGDALPDPLNYVLFSSSSPANPLLPASTPACVVAHFGTGILGFAGRVIVYFERTGSGATAQPTIVFYDVETGSSTALNRTHAVSASSITQDIGVIGTRLFITYDGTTGACVESFESSTGVFSTHDIQSAVFLGVSNSRAWFVGKVSGAGNPTRWKVISIDSSGTLSSIDNPANVTGGAQVFGRAKNGQLYFRINTSGALLYTASTSVAAASLTFTSTTAPATLPYSQTGPVGVVALFNGNRARTNSDIDSNGNCYFFVRTGTPTTAGFAVINKTALTVTTFTQQTSSLGTAADGEILLPGGLCLVGSTVVLAGAIREDLVTGGTRTASCVPAYWRTDGVTINRTDFTSYVGALGSSGNEGFARATVIHSDSVTNTFFFHTNLGNAGQAGDTVSVAKAAGPAFGEAFTV